MVTVMESSKVQGARILDLGQGVMGTRSSVMTRDNKYDMFHDEPTLDL